MSSRATLLAGSIVYGLLVFAGAASLGFVVLPRVGHATGFFPIETEAEAALSLLTLKAVPLLAGLSAAAALSYEWLTGVSALRRAGVYAVTVVLAWLTGAAIAAVILG